MAEKKIIVCADGTGNQGGYSPDSNVYKIYKAVDKKFSGNVADGFKVCEQIVFYDNGVGTEKNKYLRVLGGAFGLGFGRNVCDLYKFIARNYVAGDRIYFFGFSRGASTVRACNGMINKCGLVKGEDLRNRELDALVAEAFDIYKENKTKPEAATEFCELDNNHGTVPIHFLGVWDTVVALGFPKRTDITDPLMYLLDKLFFVFEALFNLRWPHSFYHYKLTDNVEYACQALSIDDERTAFWPYLWQEKNIEGAIDRTADNVEQVWFSGMHSNVGGGYERAGMAAVPLHWMLNRAQHHGLVFGENDVQDIESACHIHGRMYNSRDGFGFFYRYHPRDISHLSEEKLLARVKIHCSVLERMKHRTANYAPGYIPAEFEVVDSQVPANSRCLNPGESSDWLETRTKINALVLKRKRLYSAMLAFVIGSSWATFYFSSGSQHATASNEFLQSVADFFYWLLPDFFTGLINLVVVQRPYIILAAAGIIYAYLKYRTYLHRKTVSLCEKLRHFLIT